MSVSVPVSVYAVYVCTVSNSAGKDKENGSANAAQTKLVKQLRPQTVGYLQRVCYSHNPPLTFQSPRILAPNTFSLSLSLSLSLTHTHTAPSPPLRRHLQPRRREASKPLPLLPPRRSPPTHTDNPPPHTQLPRGGWRLSYPPTHPPILAQAYRHSHTESTQRGGIRRTQHPTTQLLNYRTNFTQLPY